MEEEGGPSALGLDLAAEVSSLRRVVEAFVDYPSAAEAVVRRWEQSFDWLSEEHKALLPHLPAKYASVRRCIRWNSLFISNMLQAFDPPFPLPPSAAAPGVEPFSKSGPDVGIPEGVRRGPGTDESESAADAAAREMFGRAGPSDAGPRLVPDARALDHTAALGLAGGRWQGDVGDPCNGAAQGGVEGAARLPEDGQQSFTGQGLFGGSDTQAQEMREELFVHGPPWLTINRQRAIPAADIDKVRCMLRSIVREWSEEGAPERRQAFDPILRELRRKFKHRLPASRGAPGEGSLGRGEPDPGLLSGKLETEPLPATQEAKGAPERVSAPPRAPHHSPPRCLVPGAGLGRLPLELCRLGFSCQGNEFSFYTLICSHFLLNCCSSAREWSLFPWALSSSNNVSDEAQLRAVRVPDQLASLDQEATSADTLLEAGPGEGTEGDQGACSPVDFSMCAGDFVEVYRHPSQAGAWDCVATCFFLDTAHNILEYIDIIHTLLVPGGVWVNLGPLLFHHSDSPSAPLGSSPEERRRAEMSLELSLDDVRRVAIQRGFCLERESFLQTTYSANLESMMSTHYNCVMWTMVKG